MPDQLMFVQFPHPGPEHQPSSSTMPWSPLVTADGRPVDHARKFLRVRGSYLIDGRLEDGEVAFWGEWEPPSRVLRLPARRNGYPNWLHTPTIKPVPDGPRQNTDPLVFGERFLYTNCRQSSNEKLRQLATGSLIVSGQSSPTGTSSSLTRCSSSIRARWITSWSAPNNSPIPSGSRRWCSGRLDRARDACCPKTCRAAPAIACGCTGDARLLSGQTGPFSFVPCAGHGWTSRPRRFPDPSCDCPSAGAASRG